MFTSKREKPKGKSTQLQYEHPTDGVYSKKCGLYTTRPLKWAEALERLTEINSNPSRWDYLGDSEGYTECAVKIFQLGSTNKKTVIEIKIITGIIFIHGTNHQDWLASWFDPWKQLVETGEYNCPHTNGPIESIEPTIKKNQQNELSQLWEQQKTLKTSITTLENSVSDLRNDIRKLTETVAAHHSSYEVSVENVNNICDQKVVGLLEAADGAAVGKVLKCKLELAKDIDKQKTLITKQEARFQSSIDQLRNAMNNLKPPNANVPKWSDLESVSSRCTSANESVMIEVGTLRDRMDSALSRADSKSEVNSSLEPNSVLPRLENEMKILQYNVSLMKKQMEKELQQRSDNAAPCPAQESNGGNTVPASCPTSTVIPAVSQPSGQQAPTGKKKLEGIG